MGASWRYWLPVLPLCKILFSWLTDLAVSTALIILILQDDITTLSFDSAMQQTMIANLKIISKDDSVVLSTSSKHNDFVYDFCDRLATSGSANLANAHHCSITFVEDPTISMTYNSDKSAQGFLSMTSVPKELSINDAAIIENAAVETYNAAWKKLGYTIDSFHVREAVPSSQMGSTTTVALIDVQKVADCQYCPYVSF